MNSTQLEFKARAGGSSQADRIIARLEESAGEWVAMPELARIGAGTPNGFCMVHSRIADARRVGKRMGFQIDHKNERHDGETHSFYRLEYIDQP